MHATRQRLLAMLADGHFHSGQALGDALGISRGAVWKQISGLHELGLDVYRVPGRGYRLARPLDLLDENRLAAAVSPGTRQRLGTLEVLPTVDSTNSRLADAPAGVVAACLAEHQQAGRGRRGRAWVSPFGANLYLSLAWPFETLPPDFSALGLALGVAARRALLALGVASIQLKWPNDLYASGAKLGGILLEMRGEPPGRCRLIAGIGINVAMPAEAAGQIDQRWTDLAHLAGGEPPSRNLLGARLLDHWVAALQQFERSGFAAFVEEWREADLLVGQAVEISDGRERIVGVARGIAGDGALEVETDNAVRRIIAGDATLRRQMEAS